MARNFHYHYVLNTQHWMVNCWIVYEYRLLSFRVHKLHVRHTLVILIYTPFMTKFLTAIFILFITWLYNNLSVLPYM